MRRMYSEGQLDQEIKKVIGRPENYGDLIKTWNGTIVTKEGITISGSFCKAVRNFNELQFICNFRVSNTTAESITFVGNDQKLCEFETLGEDIEGKIYSHDGLPLSEATANKSVAYTSGYVSNPGGSVVSTSMPRYISLFWLNNTKHLSFYLEGGSLSLPANTAYDFEARISLAL